MSVFVALLLGIIQGLTEFIPVSSSGHLVLAHELFGLEEVGLAFDVALHGGTLLALIVFFYKDLLRLGKALFVKTKDTSLAWLLLLATLPAVFAGVVLESQAESAFRSTTLVAVNLIIVACFMLGAEYYSQRREKKVPLAKTKTSQALAIGFAQALAIVPGVSRSGSTITAGLFTGFDRVSATRFAFLLGIPIIAGAFIKTALDGGLGEFQNQADVFIVGMVAAFISGLIAIKFLLKFLSNHSLAVFAYYRIGLGLLVLVLAFFR